MVDNHHPLDDEEPTDGDGDQPFIDGPTPTTARDFVRDSQPGPGTGKEDPVVLGDGVTDEDGGWTATGPSR
ncbi:hypothetical protein AB0I35_13045 [Nocardia sp. NPDC050378]|uniref:hypothetical protein n=1 Tax=Nocardia sp. NPDC050378 TaxID=3155400 RepID=UPI00340CE13D